MKLNKIKLTAIGGLALAGLLTGSAQADNIEMLNETFQSGATFSGLVTFDAGYDNVSAVSGTLSGGGYATENIDWIYDPSFNYAGGGGYGGNFLMSGSPPISALNWQDFVVVTWDYTTAPDLILVGGTLATSTIGYGNSIDYNDGLVSGSFTPVPDGGASIAMLGMGISGLALLRRKLLS